MIEEMLRLSPLDSRHARQLVQQFGNVSRAVVIASLLSALAQGVLAGVAFVIVGFPLAFLLTALTMLLAMIPFLGAAAVWIPSCLWLYFHDERPVAAILLTIYCALVVSLIDNLIKPLVLHGHSNLHPLLALLSVLGGVTALGPIGILVGPLAVSFLQALLVMLRTEIDEMSADPAQVAGTSPDGGEPQTGPSAAAAATTSTSPIASQPAAEKQAAAGA
jgi:predicted PurR-regulated permease PerM